MPLLSNESHSTTKIITFYFMSVDFGIFRVLLTMLLELKRYWSRKILENCGISWFVRSGFCAGSHISGHASLLELLTVLFMSFLISKMSYQPLPWVFNEDFRICIELSQLNTVQACSHPLLLLCEVNSSSYLFFFILTPFLLLPLPSYLLSILQFS